MTELTASSLCVRLGGRAVLSDASLSAGDGLTMLLGRNGCGKSTLLRALLGLIPLSGGSVSLNGENFLKLSVRERARRISYLPQHPSAMLRCPLIDYVALGANPDLGLFSVPGPKAYDRADQLIELFHLSELKKRPVDELSGGEARLAALARMKMHDALFCLMDEPLAGLDYLNQHEFLDLLRNSGTPVLLSIHDPSLAWQYADRILIMDAGRVASFGIPGDPALEDALRRVYGPSLRFETLNGRRSPYWHSTGKDQKHDV